MSLKEYNATLIYKENICEDLMIIRVKPDAQLFDFVPGQYTVIGLKESAKRINASDLSQSEKIIQRAYSIASSPLEKSHLEFYVTLVQNGSLTPRLFALEQGDRLYLSNRVTGVFTLDRVPEHKHVLLLSTGTGLAPYISMVRTSLKTDPSRKFVILHGARYSRDLGYKSYLEDLEKSNPNFFYFPSISRPKEDTSWKGLTGYLQTILMSGVLEKRSNVKLDPNQSHVFLCGNPGMIDTCFDLLSPLGYVADKGKEIGTVHKEEYW